MGSHLIFLKMKMSYHRYQVLKPVCPLYFITSDLLLIFYKFGIATWCLSVCMLIPYSLNQGIEGPEGTIYAKGVFILKIQIPERCVIFLYKYGNQTLCLTEKRSSSLPPLYYHFWYSNFCWDAGILFNHPMWLLSLPFIIRILTMEDAFALIFSIYPQR